MVLSDPTPIIGWDTTRDTWLHARKAGVSASDVSALLGFSTHKTPWAVWAEKHDIATPADPSAKEAVRIGIALEPWLIAQARHHLGVPVTRTPARLYAHPQHPWRLASPDGNATPPGGDPYGIEAKTAGLASGHGIPTGWDDGIPLGHEFQARWQMHVMGWGKVIVTSLVAGVGLRHTPVVRDVAIEHDLVDQVTDWYQRHIVEGVEPPLCAADDQIMSDAWPQPTQGSVALDGDPAIPAILDEYHDAAADERAATSRKRIALAELKRRIGDHEAGTIGGRNAVTWHAQRGRVDWEAFVADLYELADWDHDTIPTDTNPYRTPPTRVIRVK